MKKKILIFSMAVLFLISACSLFSSLNFRAVTGSGRIITESRDVSGFNRVSVCCGMELHLTQGSDETLEIEADDNLMDQIEVNVSDGVLRIQYREMSNIIYRPSQPVQLYLSAPDIRAVSVSGGGEFDVRRLEGQQFELDLSGGSEGWAESLLVDDIKISVSGGGEFKADQVDTGALNMGLSGGSDARIDDLKAQQLYLDSSGGGRTTFSGTVSDAKIDLSGGSSLNAGDLMSQEMEFQASGGGSSTAWVTDRLKLDLSGGSSLEYYGQPADLLQDLSGGSRVESLGEH